MLVAPPCVDESGVLSGGMRLCIIVVDRSVWQDIVFCLLSVCRSGSRRIFHLQAEAGTSQNQYHVVTSVPSILSNTSCS